MINKQHGLEKQQSASDIMNALDISDYIEIPQSEGQNVTISEDRKCVFFDNRKYEYGVYAGEQPLHREYLSMDKINALISNYQAWNNQVAGYATIIINNNSNCIKKVGVWDRYLHHFPDENDYDIVLLANNSASGMQYPVGKEYNGCYYYLQMPHFDIDAITAYVVNPKIANRLNAHLHFKLDIDNFLSYCINELNLRVLVANEDLFEEKRSETRKVLFYSKMWHQDDSLSDVPRKKGFELLTDRSLMQYADVVVFHMPTMSQKDKILSKKYKREGQLWVFWTMECDVHFKWQYDPRVLSLFDITMTYRLDSDVPVPYFYAAYHSWLRREVVDKSALVNAFISSNFDQSGRIKYLKELMRYIDVHSFGKALNNRKLENDDGVMAKANKIATYKFTLAFENAIAADYVTEKFFHPLIMGSVPIYLGAPNIDKFAPAGHCFINVHDFPSVKALADYLKELDNDDARYQEYLTWKKLPFRDEFNFWTNTLLRDPFVRLYNLLEERHFS